jgi:branched-chain amino acid transport system permease protein
MTRPGLPALYPALIGLALAGLVAYPLVPGTDPVIGGQLIPLFVYALLALGLNVVVGSAGLLHLGIAAFFGIGAYTAGLLTTRTLPFQQSFVVAAVAAAVVAAAAGVATAAPTLRLRGDYFALVTLGFGQILIYLITNLENFTEGTQGIKQIYVAPLPGGSYAGANAALGLRDWQGYPFFYYLCLGVLAGTALLLRNLERSPLGRAWVALREDELAASCMGLNPARLKLAAIALGAGIAGLAGALYAINLKSTAGPDAFNFNRSMITLCCLILGGLGNRSGVLLGVFLLVGYDAILSPMIDAWVQDQLPPDLRGRSFYKPSGWKLFVFGSVLILMMRFRPEGILPAARLKHEFHPPDSDGAKG